MTVAPPTRIVRAAGLLAGTVALTAGCGAPGPATTEAAFTAKGVSTVVGTIESPYGLVLSDGSGRALYATDPAVACDADCAAQWPPYRADGVPQPADRTLTPLSIAKLGTAPAADGTDQVTYAGRPLHRFEADTPAGRVAGEGVEAFGATWYLVSPGGTPVKP